jgi:hypothetical protein
MRLSRRAAIAASLSVLPFFELPGYCSLRDSRASRACPPMLRQPACPLNTARGAPLPGDRSRRWGNAHLETAEQGGGRIPSNGRPAIERNDAEVAARYSASCSRIAPSFQAADLTKVLGIGTVAIGFAFQNILQNFFAGIRLLLQEPFRLGDFISVTGIEGSVSDIQARASIVTTKGGKDAVIPNAVIFTNPVAVGHSDTQKS